IGQHVVENGPPGHHPVAAVGGGPEKIRIAPVVEAGEPTLEIPVARQAFVNVVVADQRLGHMGGTRAVHGGSPGGYWLAAFIVIARAEDRQGEKNILHINQMSILPENSHSGARAGAFRRKSPRNREKPAKKGQRGVARVKARAEASLANHKYTA